MAGFYSKDLILEEVLISNRNTLVVVVFFGATLLTAAYSIRLTLLTSLNPSHRSRLLWSSDNDQVMVRGIKCLGPLAVGAGPLLSLILLPNFYVSFLPIGLKTLAFLVSIFGLFLGVFYFIKRSNLFV